MMMKRTQSDLPDKAFLFLLLILTWSLLSTSCLNKSEVSCSDKCGYAYMDCIDSCRDAGVSLSFSFYKSGRVRAGSCAGLCENERIRCEASCRRGER